MSEKDNTLQATALAKTEGEGAKLSTWRGNEHHLQVAAAKEAGLDASDVELNLFTDAFRNATVVDDPKDHAVVVRGRTVLKLEEFAAALRSVVQYLRLMPDDFSLLVHDGRFEIRVHARAAEAAPAAMTEAKRALWIWLGCAAVGLSAMQTLPAAAALVWGGGLIVGGHILRKGAVSGRAMLAGRLALGLAMLAQEQKLILPPGESPPLLED